MFTHQAGRFNATANSVTSLRFHDRSPQPLGGDESGYRSGLDGNKMEGKDNQINP